MKTTKHSTLAALAVLAGSFCAMGRATTVFNFDNDLQGTSTSFTDTVSGVSATFSSPGNPGVYSVQPSFFATLTGNVLASPNSASLNISFSTNLSAITLLFATGDFTTPSPVTLSAYEGNTLVGSNTLAGMFLAGFIFPEGKIAFSGANFNSVVLSSPAVGLAIDNVVVAPGTATPEPGSEWLLGFGLIALGIPATRRHTS
jgi:hypothetical protein